MKKIYFVFLIPFLYATSVYASTQMSDTLIYNGIEYSLDTEPLYPYFLKYPNKKPKIEVTNSALSRGYIARFEIIENELYLIDIMIMKEISQHNYDFVSVLNEYFGGKTKLDFYTGRLWLTVGKQTGIYMAFTPLYDKYWIIEIEKGIFVSEYYYNEIEYIQNVLNGDYDEYTKEYYRKILDEAYKRREDSNH